MSLSEVRSGEDLSLFPNFPTWMHLIFCQEKIRNFWRAFFMFSLNRSSLKLTSLKHHQWLKSWSPFLSHITKSPVFVILCWGTQPLNYWVNSVKEVIILCGCFVCNLCGVIDIWPSLNIISSYFKSNWTLCKIFLFKLYYKHNIWTLNEQRGK